MWELTSDMVEDISGLDTSGFDIMYEKKNLDDEIVGGTKVEEDHIDNCF